jgi:hypothetical protein
MHCVDVWNGGLMIHTHRHNVRPRTHSLTGLLPPPPHYSNNNNSGSADGKIIVWRLDTLTYHRAFTSAGESIQVGKEGTGKSSFGFYLCVCACWLRTRSLARSCTWWVRPP